ncbi:MAG: replication initiation protein [Butyrivibrio sp.]|nr:replication initiation protein [Butyrivibrio sp.]
MYTTQDPAIHAQETQFTGDTLLLQSIRMEKYSLSALEQKILYFFISRLQQDCSCDDMQQYRYVFDLAEFCRAYGIDDDNGRNYINIRNAIIKLSYDSFWIKTDAGTLD